MTVHGPALAKHPLLKLFCSFKLYQHTVVVTLILSEYYYLWLVRTMNQPQRSNWWSASWCFPTRYRRDAPFSSSCKMSSSLRLHWLRLWRWRFAKKLETRRNWKNNLNKPLWERYIKCRKTSTSFRILWQNKSPQLIKTHPDWQSWTVSCRKSRPFCSAQKPRMRWSASLRVLPGAPKRSSWQTKWQK